ncbi:MAG: flavodoxin family protein [Actinobacteria bacterium]|nr:flavodoxin family protein [Actinomycetota bacterium]
MKVVAFNGSSRKDGNTAILLRYVLGELEQAGVETELVQLAGTRLSGCAACLKCRDTKDMTCAIKNDVVNACIQKMVAADGILLGSPVYFADVTATMKALIERAGYVTRGNHCALRRKVGAAVVAVRRGGAVHTFDSINHFFQISEMVVVGSSYWNLGVGQPIGAVEEDAEGIQTMRTLGQNMAWVLRRLSE